MTHILYRYRPLANDDDCQYLLDVFKNNRLFCPAPGLFNDPFECRAKISFSAPESMKTERAKCQLLREVVTETGDALDRLAEPKWRDMEARGEQPFLKWLREDTGVVSFAAIPNDLLMWSHYASQHTGVCIRFEAVTESHVDFFAQIFPVRYQDALPEINFYTTPELEKLHAYILTKSRHWCYEQEWRRIVVANKQPRFLPIPPGVVSAIYLGCRIKESIREAILSAAQQSPTCSCLNVFQAELSPDSYSLTFVPLGGHSATPGPK